MSAQDNRCPDCRAKNPATAVTCEACGAALSFTMPIARRNPRVDPPPAPTDQAQGADEATHPVKRPNPAFRTKRIKFEPEESDEIIIGIPRLEGDLILQETQTEMEFRVSSDLLKVGALVGRHDSSQDHTPTVDLEQVGGHQAGVSRFHATLFWQHNLLHVVDHNSTNGTFLNARLLVPEQKVIIRDGDTIGFGRVEMKVRFERKFPQKRTLS